MVDVFKTSVRKIRQSQLMLEVLSICFPDSEISFDLEDCDNILRIKHEGIPAEDIIDLLIRYGFHCEELSN